ncbi:MAG: hypothetical protein JO029_06210 [Candidatus Eremiobacteraeota bacterium]|nr:hypothetical protein [Candidatus Eremiobacteraeota bacterium]MBV8433858.1 hypothetical protein [Candidatus Eremiobacteraeota bacterium]MBV8723133.1 hypothetical protein [Candidatus Eremiobacteraeota bacterium]
MNALLIAGMIGLALWWQRRREASARRIQRADDYLLSHALRSRDAWD